MNTLPFTLTPLAGESFTSWISTYATRVRCTPQQLGAALSLPLGSRALHRNGPTIGQRRSAALATGLNETAIHRMFHTPIPHTVGQLSVPPASAQAWAPQATSRFCPHCLAGNSGRFLLGWQSPLTFACLEHHTLLATACSRCGQPPLSTQTSTTSLATCQRREPDDQPPANPTAPPCAHTLTATPPPAAADLPAALDAQRHITARLQALNDTVPDTARDGTADSDQVAVDALHDLIDLSAIAYHLATLGTHRVKQPLKPHMLHAESLTQAVRILTAPTRRDGDLLAELVTTHYRGNRPEAIPDSWHTATPSPALATRIMFARDTSLRALDRLRYATTLPTPAIPTTIRDDAGHSAGQDAGLLRAARIPDQLWPAWAIRLTDDESVEPVMFRTSAAAALLLPHSRTELRDLTAALSANLTPATPTPAMVRHHMTKLARGAGGTTALRILTELAIAIDANNIPIDYARRRRLAANTDLIDAATWKQICAHTPMGAGSSRRLSFARTYLYELITGNNIGTAPEPYRVKIGTYQRFCYLNEFIPAIPEAVATLLAGHARALLADAGIAGEPLQWQPPTNWVTTSTWPGADPDRTDPEPILTTVIDQNTPIPTAAQQLRISAEHIRYVLRNNPSTGARRPATRTNQVIDLDRGPSQVKTPGIRYIDPDWFTEQYHTWRRTITEIAADLGCKPATLKRLLERNTIPLRPRNSGRQYIRTGTTTVHPSLLPNPLRNALLGPSALSRLQRFLTAAEHPSLTATARTLGCHSSTLTTQIASLEATCGGPLLHRTAAGRLPHGLQPTHLGQQLRQQAKDHLQITGVKPAALTGLPQPLQTVLAPAHGKARLERFLTVTEHRTLTAAANTLGTSPNALSTQMQKLETTCGAALFHRNTHNESRGGHNLTPLGHRLREQARQHLTHPPHPTE